MVTRTPLSIAIVGAGLGGLTAAMKGGNDDTAWLYGYDAWNVPLTTAATSIP